MRFNRLNPNGSARSAVIWSEHWLETLTKGNNSKARYETEMRQVPERNVPGRLEYVG
jgi:hypothetical protein